MREQLNMQRVVETHIQDMHTEAEKLLDLSDAELAAVEIRVRTGIDASCLDIMVGELLPGDLRKYTDNRRVVALARGLESELQTSGLIDHYGGGEDVEEDTKKTRMQFLEDVARAGLEKTRTAREETV